MFKKKNHSIFTDYFYLKYILNKEEYFKCKICYYWGKNNFNHCKFNITKSDIIINLYNNDQLILDKLKKKHFLYNFKIISKDKNLEYTK